jgi:hypothetical protein
LSQKIVILWTLDGLPASSIFSNRIGLKQDLKPGYNLVELGELKDDGSDGDSDSACTNCDDSEEPPESEPCPDDVCDDPFRAEALARYNAAHGTDYATVEDAYAQLDPFLNGSIPDDETQYDALYAFEDELYFYEHQVQLEHGVDISELDGTRVIEDWHTPLVITISPDVEPLL